MFTDNGPDYICPKCGRDILGEIGHECGEDNMAQFFVEIVNYETDEVVKRMGPMDERKADKVDSGANINLNHNEYFTRIIEAD